MFTTVVYTKQAGNVTGVWPCYSAVYISTDS